METIINKDRVKQLMNIKNIKNQTELAQVIGISKNELSRILSPKYDYLKSNIRKLCEVLDTNLDDITSSINNNLTNENFTEKRIATIVDITTVKAKKNYNVLELFAGAGGLALGLEKAGFNTVGLNEINKHACSTLRKNRENWNIIEDDIINIVKNGVRQYIGETTKVDLLSGGYPCQSFSYAGKKLGLEDTRGTMFYYYSEILKELKPKMFLAENVKGLLTHDNGRTLKTMIDVFEEIGYKVSYEVLNSKFYGVAQKRERIVIMGIRKDLWENGINISFPKKFDTLKTLKEALKDVPNSEGAKYPDKKKKVLELIPPGGYWRDLPEEIAKEYMGKSYYSGGGRTGMARKISWEEQCLTLTCSPAQKQTERCHPDEIRPFTVREYARIQSFPDEWTFEGSMNEKYKQIGNAVPVEFAKAIGLAIINTLNQI